MVTTIVILCLLTIYLGSAIFWACFLRWGLRWAKVQNASKIRLLLTAIVALLLQAILSVVFIVMKEDSPERLLFLTIVEIFCVILIACLTIKVFFKTTFLRSVQSWLPTLLASIILALMELFVLSPYLFEPFVIPTNAMAPTLLGQHWKGTCPDCGSSTFGSPIPSIFAGQEPSEMICQANFHRTRPTEREDQVFPSDRILVTKFLQPQRWDLLVFHYPGDPAKIYCMRLVGMPGETITIREGRVFANGQQMEEPEAIRGLRFLDEILHLSKQFGPLWGSVESPAELAEDEYFVLGDFTSQSKDSRLWDLGAEGHPPYAVPKSHVLGVVSHTYYPFHRMRAFR